MRLILIGEKSLMGWKMDSDDPIAEAHMAEILEGIFDPTVTDEDWSELNKRWKEIDQPQDGSYAMRFSGPPRQTETDFPCPHCGQRISSIGVSFRQSDTQGAVEERQSFVHMVVKGSCSNAEDCKCWHVTLKDDGGKHTARACTVCLQSEWDCTFGSGPTYGPCCKTGYKVPP